MNKDVLDIEDVLDRVQDDWELLLELFSIFEDDYQEKRQRLTEAMAANDFEQIRNLAHSMKGASGNISAKLVHASCARIEEFAEQNQSAKVKAELAVLDEQFVQLQACIKQLREKYENSK